MTTETTTAALAAVPDIRRALCRAIGDAQSARRIGERRTEMATATAYRHTLRLLVAQGPLPAGIAPSPVGDPRDAEDEAAARAWLGETADALLGPT